MENNVYNNLASNITTDSSTSLWLIVAGIGLLLAAIVFVYRYTLFPTKIPSDIATVEKPATRTDTPPPFTNETWCLVGEDLSGRYCVRVPSEYSCDPNRTFPSRTDCELTPANALPSGIATQNGTKLTPLGSLSSSS